MKSNDNIPADEMLLAEAIAAAIARGMRWTRGAVFTDDNFQSVKADAATHCCAVGGLVLAGRTTVLPGTGYALHTHLRQTHVGNDYNGSWDSALSDNGESLGWAFRCAMTEEP